MSPEVKNNKYLTECINPFLSDVFSLGLVILRMMGLSNDDLDEVVPSSSEFYTSKVILQCIKRIFDDE